MELHVVKNCSGKPEGAVSTREPVASIAAARVRVAELLVERYASVTAEVLDAAGEVLSEFDGSAWKHHSEAENEQAVARLQADLAQANEQMRTARVRLQAVAQALAETQSERDHLKARVTSLEGEIDVMRRWWPFPEEDVSRGWAVSPGEEEPSRFVAVFSDEQEAEAYAVWRQDREHSLADDDRDPSWELREIYASITAGVSCAAIAESLNLDATPGARAQRRRKAKHWTSDRVWRLATSRTYRGEWTVNKAQGAVITVPTIIDPDDWDATQRAMTSPLRGTPRGKSPIICLASRLARCALCGSVVQVHMRSGGAAGRRYQYYVCRAVSHPRTKAEKCPLKARRIEEVDARLWAAVERFLVEGWPGIEARMLTAIKARQGQGDEVRGQLELAERELRRLAGAEGALLVRFRRGAVSEDALDVALAALAEDRRAAEVERDQARAALGREAAGVEALGQAIAGARALLPNAPPEIRQQLVRALIEPGALRLGQWSIEATVSLSWDALATGAALQAGSSPRRAHQPRDLAYRMAVELVA
jgi:hypothetical protein